ncbi:MAG: hypothetical protein R3B49_01405 [Phycisphaerales bacterium]
MRTPTAELVAPDVIQLLADKKWREVRAALDHLEPADAADVIDTIEPEEEAAVAFRLLPREFAADVFSHLEQEKQERFLIELLGMTGDALDRGARPGRPGGGARRAARGGWRRR